MPSDTYSFLDVAVLDEVRQRFASGDAMVILSADLEQVIWANGPGANLFGHADIDAVIGASAGLPPIARRQIMATSGFPDIGHDRSIMVRLASGMTSRAIGFLASAVTMPDGEKAIMLAVPAGHSASRSAAEIAGRAISGFADDGHFIAFIDARGGVEAASAGFGALGITEQTLAALVADVAGETDRIVKRMVPGAEKSYPAGLARLTDQPARHLLVVIHEDAFEGEAEATAAAAGGQVAAEPQSTAEPGATEAVDPISAENAFEQQAASDSPADSIAEGSKPDAADKPGADSNPVEEASAAETAKQATSAPQANAPGEPAAASAAEVATAADDEPAIQTSAEAAAPVQADAPEVAPAPPAEASSTPEAGSAALPAPPENRAVSTIPVDADAPGRHDQWYFNAGGEDTLPAAPLAQGDDGDTSRPDAGAAPRAEQGTTPPAGAPATPPAASAEERAIAPTIDRSSQPVRFVWRTDAEGRFNAISPEFAETVGNAAADIIGRKFKDVAAAFGLDPAGEIAGLLERRDTWSGRSVLWPVAGTDLRIPVDLAALPVYGRSRGFEGFRGFGVARTADAVVDPEGIGLVLVPSGETAENTSVSPPAPEPEPPKPADPFKGEVPALAIVPKPERRFADKVIRLAEHRQPANDKGLSTLERTAFREIGERLKKDSSPDAAQGQQKTAPSDGGMASNDAANLGNEAVVSANQVVEGANQGAIAPSKVSEPTGVTDGAGTRTSHSASEVDLSASGRSREDVTDDGTPAVAEADADTEASGVEAGSMAGEPDQDVVAAEAGTSLEADRAEIDPEGAEAGASGAVAIGDVARPEGTDVEVTDLTPSAIDETPVATEDLAEAGTAGAELDQEVGQDSTGEAPADALPQAAGDLQIADKTSVETSGTAVADSAPQQPAIVLRGPATHAGLFSSAGPVFERTPAANGVDAAQAASLALPAEAGATTVGGDMNAPAGIAVGTAQSEFPEGQAATAAGDAAEAALVASDDDSMALADFSDAEDQEDLLRMDGASAPVEPVPANRSVGVSGSLLDFIRDDDDRPAYVAANSDGPAAALTETDRTGSPAAVEESEALEQSAPVEPPAMVQRTGSPDSSDEEALAAAEQPAAEQGPISFAEVAAAEAATTEEAPQAGATQSVEPQATAETVAGGDDDMAADDFRDARDDQAPADDGLAGQADAGIEPAAGEADGAISGISGQKTSEAGGDAMQMAETPGTTPAADDHQAVASGGDQIAPALITTPAAGEGTEPEADSIIGKGEEFGRAQPSTGDASTQPEVAAAAPNEPARPEASPGPSAPALKPRLSVPPLKTSGFVPSAFSTGPRPQETDTSILDKLPIPLLIHSGDVLHYANEEFLDLTGYDTLDDLERAGGLDALFADPYADEGAPDSGDRTLRLRTQDELEFPIGAILRSVPWRGGKALMLVVRRSGDEDGEAVAPQVSTAPVQTLAEVQQQPDVSELKARIAEMRTIIDTATDGVVLIGRDGTIRSISRPAEALFGFDSDEVSGKPFASLFAIESQRAARDYLTGLSEHGVASVLNDGREVIGREAQGRFIPLFMTIGRLPNDSGFCAVVRDITQWKRAEEDLTQARAVAERASSQKTDFLARISHEIRTPLNAIIGFSELMVDEKFGPVANDRYRDYLRDINRSGNHVLDLVNDLLDISKIEAGQQEMDYEAVSLNDTLAETVAMMQPQANRERVIIRSSFASRLPEVVADLRSIRQIALNILSNAIRYTQAGGQVIVSTAYEPSGDVVMRVRDTGIGMSQAEIEQALKPFKQINALKRGRGDGTGLGLPLTKAMVEANRARFSINSTPGEGTLVEVSFPSTRVLAG